MTYCNGKCFKDKGDRAAMIAKEKREKRKAIFHTILFMIMLVSLFIVAFLVNIGEKNLGQALAIGISFVWINNTTFEFYRTLRARCRNGEETT